MCEDYQQSAKKPSFLKKLLKVARSPTLSRAKHHRIVYTDSDLTLKAIPAPPMLGRSMSASCATSPPALPTNAQLQRSLTSPASTRISFDDFLEHDNSEYTIRMSLTPALIREHEAPNIRSH
ncbi:hypothetical protein K493DRAFT_298371 [Basidiobolus meristosporus CBS 931.73]|uniref:Uncharacterized protein n=1 Tax=Basidiobolus meristosporus CBS 931.73 TaxID=1314790 RepID=A0A1Y1YU30_9FUNG|nr:hypothetical protein K493DRAFT_298371 [Basidiobolus meristosporus CBS 931.73]|eukprot:ORY01476.1 hypothetical protein K493DRAFT_298371 [Basidiobolus meristosporus CBS 931.73]